MLRMILFGGLFLVFSASNAHTIEQFVLASERQSIHPEVSSCVIEPLSRAEKKINQRLAQGNRYASHQLTNELLSNKDKLALAKLAKCYTRINELNIERLPAIVIDGEYVIYGLSDAAKAKSLLEQYKRSAL